jgi:lipoate-protein ligase A
MAMDDALMARAAATGEWVFRVYSWRAPTLSLGRNQRAHGAYDLAALSARGIGVVRRPTGGRALLHDREVTYSVTGPAATGDTLRASYGRINGMLVAGLRSLGVECAIAGAGARAAAPTLTPCFERPAAGELVLADRKLAGSAQWREGGALLQHGSILLDGDQALVAALLNRPVPPPPPPATLRLALGRLPAVEEVAEALFAAVRGMADPEARPLAPDAALAAAVTARTAAYADPAWTWRR